MHVQIYWIFVAMEMKLLTKGADIDAIDALSTKVRSATSIFTPTCLHPCSTPFLYVGLFSWPRWLVYLSLYFAPLDWWSFECWTPISSIPVCRMLFGVADGCFINKVKHHGLSLKKSDFNQRWRTKFLFEVG